MNREIKFRGKSLDGDWVYGSYHHSGDKKHHYILIKEKFIKDVKMSMLHNKEVVEVYPESVGQLCPNKDSSGKEVYEGDICKYINNDLGFIRFDYGWVIEYSDTYSHDMPPYYFEKLSVVGNMYDNIDLFLNKNH